MAVSREDFTEQLDIAVAGLSNFPVTAALMGHLSSELKRGEPAWWKRTAQAWAKRKFTHWDDAWVLFLTCVHFEALNNENSPLIPYFPSCGGTPEVDPSAVFAKFLENPSPAFWENLEQGRYWRFYEAFLREWMGPAVSFFHARQMPYYLVELNGGGGLHLAGDFIKPWPTGFNSGLVEARIALDPKPILVGDTLHRRWVTAGIKPDNMRAVEFLDNSIDVVLAALRDDPAFLQVVECALEDAPAFLKENVPADDPDVGLFVMNIGATSGLSDAEYARFQKGMADLLRPWENRGLWMEIEPARGEVYPQTYISRLARFREKEFQTRVSASYRFSPKLTVDYQRKATETFLRP